MRRLMLILGGVALATATMTGIATAANATGDDCVTAAEATYQHRFDGPGGTVTITATKPLCKGEEQAFSLVSYTAPGKNFAVPQFVHEAKSAWVDSGRRSVTLDVDVPGCYTQVDAIFGTGIVNEITSSYVYNDLKLGSPAGIGSRSSGGRGWYNGGAATCTPQPSVTFQSYCDGVLHTRLANAAGAGVDAVFVVGGKRIRVEPGSHADLASRPSGAVEVRDNSFTTSTGRWAQPADCAPPATPSTSTPASAVPASSAPASSVPTSSAPASSVPASSAPASVPASSVPVSAVPVSSAPGSSAPVVVVPSPTAGDGTDLPLTGSNSGRLGLYALGFLLVGGGLVAVARQSRRGRHSA
ncbi:hypothetical protein AB0F81_33015 [Actinoplanes sp. NPDC024001]|uniref:hypothetical protein n=1 Tax=Actinoplanes sp. NPDC024001 TaxID=3154598 RepID=UPI0033E88478